MLIIEFQIGLLKNLLFGKYGRALVFFLKGGKVIEGELMKY